MKETDRLFRQIKFDIPKDLVKVLGTNNVADYYRVESIIMNDAIDARNCSAHLIWVDGRPYVLDGELKWVQTFLDQFWGDVTVEYVEE